MTDRHIHIDTVVLLSGGLDSATCLALTRPAAALLVNYGQPHWGHESKAAVTIARELCGSPLYTATITLPTRIDHTDPSMLIPGRNLILLSLAATIADHVVIGANADDYADYPDCRPEFFRAAEPALGVTIDTPLIDMTKREIGKLARKLGVPIESTWSCYYPLPSGQPCGNCDACRHRAEATA
jgi:7-cyano-7-deazaguanine synthase